MSLEILEINVLVVDDYLPIRRTLCSLLRQMGFRSIDDIGDAESALAKMKDRPYGLVISDWKMEPVSGLEFLKQVRANEGLKDIPFLMVTAAGTQEEVVMAKEAGVSDFIVKPFNLATLKKKIHSVLGMEHDSNQMAAVSP
jgi:two-component system, chemotaxis family, chemotaxis protein CheY